MPQVVAFVASAITATSSAVVGATLAVTGSATLAAAAGNFTLGLLSLGTMTSELAGIAGTLGAVVGISGLSALAAPKPPPYHTQLSATKSSIGQRSMLMGRTAVGGTINTDYMTSGRKNGVSSIVYTLSHVGKSGYVESVIWGQDTITFNSPVNGIQAAIGKYNGAMWLVQKSGDWSQSAININLGGNGLEAGAHPSEWRSTDRCGGCLTVMLIIGNTHSVFKENSHNPIFVTNANEVDLIDPRTGAAATTTAQKTNPWVWAYSYAQKWLSSTGIKVAGIGLIAATQLITSSFSYAANIADTNNWKIGGEIKIDPNNAFNDLRNIAQAGGGDISFKNGKLVATVAAPKTPSAIITEDDLRDRPIWQSAVETSKLPNRIIPRFISEANLWQVVDGTVITDSSFVTQQNGNKITTTLDLPYSVGATQSGQLAAYGLLNAREPIKWSIPLKPQARFIGSNGDCVQLQFPNCGFATHNIIITKLTVNNDLSIDIEGISETDGKDDWALGKTTTPPDFSTITPYDLTNIPQPDVGQWTANATTITGGDTIIPIIRITGSNSDYLAASGIIVKYRLNTTGSPWLGSFNLQKTATNFEINEVSPNTSYIIGIAYLGITGLEGSVRELSAVTTGNLQAGMAASADIANGIVNQSPIAAGNSLTTSDVTNSLITINSNGTLNNAGGGQVTIGGIGGVDVSTFSAAIANEATTRASADSANANTIATVSAKLDVAPNLFPYPRPKNLTDAPSSYGWITELWGGSGAFNVNYSAGDSYWKGSHYYIDRIQANAAAAVRIARFNLEPLQCGFGALYTNKPVTISARAAQSTGVSGDNSSVYLIVLDASGNIVAWADTPNLPINTSIGPDKRQSWTFNFSSLPQNPIPPNAYKLAVVFRHNIGATNSSPPYQFLGFTDIKVEFGSVATAYTNEGNNTAIQAQTSILQSTVANVKGELEAKIALTADAGGTVTGIEIISVDGTNTPLSKIKFTAAKAEFSGDVLVDGTLTASKIVDNSISTSKIAPNAATNVIIFYEASTLSCQPSVWTTVATLPITVNDSGIKIKLDGDFLLDPPANQQTTTDVRLVKEISANPVWVPAQAEYWDDEPVFDPVTHSFILEPVYHPAVAAHWYTPPASVTVLKQYAGLAEAIYAASAYRTVSNIAVHIQKTDTPEVGNPVYKLQVKQNSANNSVAKERELTATIFKV